MATVKLSRALRNHVLNYGSWKNAFTNGRIRIYSGSGPTNAEDAETGALLGTITDTSGAFTQEVRATSTVTLTGGASGSVDNIQIGGIDMLQVPVPFNQSLTQTAADVAAQLNRASPLLYRVMATSAGAVVTITMIFGFGATFNGTLPTCGSTTITTAVVAFAGGVTPINGLRLSSASGGVLQKDLSQAWSCNAVGSGAAGYARFLASIADAGATDAAEAFIRLQMDVAAGGGGALNLSSLQFTTGAPINVTSFMLTAGAT